MECHLPATELKRDGRACPFNYSAACRLEHGFDAHPLNVPIDWVGEHPLKGLALGSVHSLDDSTVTAMCYHAAGGSTKAVLAKPNVRAEAGPTAGRQGPPAENVQRTCRRALVACRWRSA